MTDSRLIAFKYFGGKHSKLKWLLPLLDIPCKGYGEPFAGSASVLLNRQPLDYEYINDMNGDIVNFFRMLRDYPDELILMLEMTPHSREEAYLAHNKLMVFSSLVTNRENLERARCWFTKINQSFSQAPAHRDWGFNFYRNRAKQWVDRIENLAPVIARLRGVQIEHSNALDAIQRYDEPEVLQYVDPPYPIESGADRDDYLLKFGLPEHAQLAELLHRCRGKIAISGYPGYMDTLYADWQRHILDTFTGIRATMDIQQAIRPDARIEVLWTNYTIDPVADSQPEGDV